MDVDPTEAGEALDQAMNDRARKELREFRKAVKQEDASGPVGRSHQKDSKRRKKVKKQRAKEKRRQDVPPETEEGEKRAVQFGEGPKRSSNEHVYNPADITHYANWRLDLADANGLALGDDEAESAMRQLQMLVSDVDMLPPLYRSKDDGELYLKSGRPARMLRPRDFCLMVLEEGHWISVTALKVKEDDTWAVSITGIPRLDQQDQMEWKATLTQLTDIPVAKLKISEGPKPYSVSGACGFAALMAISTQCENNWEWNPMDSTFFTADPVLNAKIFSHLVNLRRCLQAHDAPSYYSMVVFGSLKRW